MGLVGSPMEPLAVLRALLATALVLFTPGFALTLALWPRTKEEIYRESWGSSGGPGRERWI